MQTAHDTTRRLAYPIPESAYLLGISARGLYRLIDAGHLRTVKLGRRRLVPADELDRMIHQPSAAA